jgi:hypothetical protein
MGLMAARRTSGLFCTNVLREPPRRSRCRITPETLCRGGMLSHSVSHWIVKGGPNRSILELPIFASRIRRRPLPPNSLDRPRVKVGMRRRQHQQALLHDLLPTLRCLHKVAPAGLGGCTSQVQGNHPTPLSFGSGARASRQDGKRNTCKVRIRSLVERKVQGRKQIDHCRSRSF